MQCGHHMVPIGDPDATKWAGSFGSQQQKITSYVFKFDEQLQMPFPWRIHCMVYMLTWLGYIDGKC